MKNRSVGLDIIRVLSMMGIIGLHIMNQGGVLRETNLVSINYVSYLLLLSVLYTSVNVFGLLSGYLNIEKKNNKTKRIIELISILLFWSSIITIVYYIFNISSFRSLGKVEIIKSLFPPIAGSYWYITSYVLLFFMMPYLNLFATTIEKSKYKKLLIILFVFFSIIPNLLLHTDFFRIEFGYSPFWLIYMYMLGGYIKLYGISFKGKKALLLIASILLACILNYFIKYVSIILLGKIIDSEYFIDYISPFTVISSVLLLIIFVNINIKNNIFNKVVLFFSKSAFAVYIIHCHRAIFLNTLKDMFIPINNYNVIISVLLITLSIVVTYIVCTLLDEIRKILFKFLKINNLIKYTGEKLDSIFNM